MNENEPDGFILAVGGLGTPPKSLWDLGDAISAKLPDWIYRTYQHNERERIHSDLKIWRQYGKPVRAFGHSLGARRLYLLARDDAMVFDRLALLDFVWMDWDGESLTRQKSVRDMRTWRKDAGIPPSVGLPGADTVFYDCSHNEVVEKAAAEVTTFLTAEAT